MREALRSALTRLLSHVDHRSPLAQARASYSALESEILAVSTLLSEAQGSDKAWLEEVLEQHKVQQESVLAEQWPNNVSEHLDLFQEQETEKISFSSRAAVMELRPGALSTSYLPVITSLCFRCRWRRLDHIYLIRSPTT